MNGFVAAAAFAAALSALPAQASAPPGFGQLAGAGTAAGIGCAGPVQVSGMSAVPGSWTFEVGFAGAGIICGATGAAIASGAWSPATGGCLTGPTGTVCVGPVPATGSTAATSIAFCLPAMACYSGTVTVLRV